jgi:hypothetical protein
MLRSISKGDRNQFRGATNAANTQFRHRIRFTLLLALSYMTNYSGTNISGCKVFLAAEYEPPALQRSSHRMRSDELSEIVNSADKVKRRMRFNSICDLSGGYPSPTRLSNLLAAALVFGAIVEPDIADEQTPTWSSNVRD